MPSQNQSWWSAETVAVVTGANRGIGFEIVRQLAQQGLTVVLTARGDHSRGETALKSLALPNVFFHPLDVQNLASISHFLNWFTNKFGSLNILINNAAINGVDVDYEYLKSHNLDLSDIMKDFPKHVYRVEHDSARNCIDVNYYGVKRTVEALLPLLVKSASAGGARIINVSSSYGMLKELNYIPLQQWMNKVENLSIKYIEDDFINKFLHDVKTGDWSIDGNVWPSKHPVYKISKIALNAYTRVLDNQLQSKEFSDHYKNLVPLANNNGSEKYSKRGKIFINCIHPGEVKTQLSFNNGHLTPSEGADPIVKLALMPHNRCPTGQFFVRYNVSNFEES